MSLFSFDMSFLLRKVEDVTTISKLQSLTLVRINMSFLLRKVEDVTTIIKLQSLTLVRIKDCTLRVANKTTTSFL